MADLTSITQKAITGTAQSLAKYGAIRVFEGTFPTTSATATCPVGDLTANDLVIVLPVAASANTKPFIEILASRTTGATGVVTIGTQDGTNSAATVLVWVVVFKL